MITTIYQCDKCGAKQENSDQFWIIGIKAHMISMISLKSDEFVHGEKYQMQVCRPCLESFGVYAQHKEIAGPVHEPTLEEIITEIAQRAVS